MKTPKIFLLAGALVALAASAPAADTGTPSPDADIPAEPTPAATLDSGTATFGGQQFNSSGIMVRNGKAYIVHRLQSEMSLPNGTKIEPNGTVLGGDGQKQPMAPGQMMTLDGQVKPAPFTTGVDKGLFDEKSPSIPIEGKKPSEVFAPSSGSFPGVSDTLNFESSTPRVEEDEFSD